MDNTDLYRLTPVEVANCYEGAVVAVDAADYHGDDIDELRHCPPGYRLLMDAECRILGFVPAHLAVTLAKALNVAAETILRNQGGT